MARSRRSQGPSCPPSQLNFVAIARVSSFDQRDGYSLDAQEQAIREKAAREGWNIVQVSRLVETASKSNARREFRKVLSFVRQNRRADGGHIDGLIFHKVDRAVRNVRDPILLEDLGVLIRFVVEDFPDSPSGRLTFHLMVGFATFYSANLREEVMKGMNQRAANGWLPGRAPYGYLNKPGRDAAIVPCPEAAPKVQRVFHLYSSGNQTLDSLGDALLKEGILFSSAEHRFPRSTLHRILTDSFYIGRFRWNGIEFHGEHDPIVEESVWNRVQEVLGGRNYGKSELPFAGGLIRCAHCDSDITGERKKKGGREYDYYRCSRYTRRDLHPKPPGELRVTGNELGRLLGGLVGRVRLDDPEVGAWFRAVLLESHEQESRYHAQVLSSLQGQYVKIETRLTNLMKSYYQEEIDRPTFEQLRKDWTTERESLKATMAQHERSVEQDRELGVQVFELTQALPERWLVADPIAKRQLLEILLLNCAFDGASLSATYRKPFDVLAEGLAAGDGGPCWI